MYNKFPFTTICELHRQMCPHAWGYLLLFTVNNGVYKQISMTMHIWLWISTFLQNFMALSISVFELYEFNLKEKKKKKSTEVNPRRTAHTRYH